MADKETIQRILGEIEHDLNPLALAIHEIYASYGDLVSVTQKDKALLKYGENSAVGSSSRATIWSTGVDQANETYAADNTNPIDSVSSSSGSDTQVITIEGHTMTGGQKTFVSQNVTLNGQTRVALTTPLNRSTMAYHADQSSTNLVGNIYIYENTSLTTGKPTDTTKIHLTIPAGENRSQKAATSLSSTDYWIITSFSAGFKQKTGTNLADVRLEIRSSGGVFKPVCRPIVMITGQSDKRDFTPYIIAPKNSDVRLTALASASGQDIVGDINGYLAKVL